MQRPARDSRRAGGTRVRRGPTRANLPAVRRHTGGVQPLSAVAMPGFPASEPIVAIATPAGRGAVGIVRISGPDLGPLIDALCARRLEPRHATLVPFRAADGGRLDRGLAIHFPAPNSYTGEDLLELHAHGGPVLLELLVARCLEALPGARLARPGEFTERAFLNDKLDLAQAEAVADLIDASTEAAARSAARALEGALSAEVHALAERIVRLRTLVEATLDFPDEEIEFLETHGARAELDALAAALDALLERTRQGVLLREGLRIVIAGQPNVGKSSLLNALAGAELAIVTPIAGTTRDKVGATIQIGGIAVHVVDTAGLRAESDAEEVERLGIARSWQAIGDADAVLFVHDLARRGEPAYEAAETEIAARLAGIDVLHVHNKADRAPELPARASGAGGNGVVVSATTGAGLDALRAALLERAGAAALPEGLTIARRRHVEALRATRERLAAARANAAQGDAALELVAEELRLAHRSLMSITGEFTTEELLGSIFGRFCIGK